MGKRLKMNINTEKKLIKEVNATHETERKSFETKMKEQNDNIIQLEIFIVEERIQCKIK